MKLKNQYVVILIIVSITISIIGITSISQSTSSSDSITSKSILGSDEITSLLLLSTNKTVINQVIQYPDGSPLITSKIVTIPVGAETGPHVHDSPMFGYVMEGEITVDYGDRGVLRFVQGDSLVEAINYTHNGKNSGDKPAKILIVLMGEN